MIDFFYEIGDMFSYFFIQRAFIVGILVTLCCALLGVSLVLKRYSMIGDGLSHTAFGAASIAAALNILPFFELYFPIDPTVFTIILVVIVAFLLLRMTSNSKINSDSAIALVSTTFLTIGIIAVSMTTGLNTDVCNTLFGTILALSSADLVVSIILCIIVLILYIFFYNKIFAITFDENFARATGIKVNLYNMLLALLTAITIVMGMKLMGTLLISSLLILPALTSMRLFKTFKSVIICSVITSTICFVIGIIASYMFNLPTGGTIVLTNLIGFVIFSILSKVGEMKKC